MYVPRLRKYAQATKYSIYVLTARGNAGHLNEERTRCFVFFRCVYADPFPAFRGRHGNASSRLTAYPHVCRYVEKSTANIPQIAKRAGADSHLSPAANCAASSRIIRSNSSDSHRRLSSASLSLSTRRRASPVALNRALARRSASCSFLLSFAAWRSFARFSRSAASTLCSAAYHVCDMFGGVVEYEYHDSFGMADQKG